MNRGDRRGCGISAESGQQDGDPQQRLAAHDAAVLSSDNEIVTPAGQRWQAPAGHSGLGTSGSGDVLAGALVGSLGFLARELLDQLPQVLTELQA